jgi:diguanylate cyclase (GGDEF)-like protein
MNADTDTLINESGYAEKRQNRKKTAKRSDGASVLLIRWVLLAVLAILFIIQPPVRHSVLVLLETFAVAVIYNSLVTYHTLNRSQNGKRIGTAVIYLDIVVLSVFSYLSGGVHSDVFILLLFLIGYCGLFNNSADTVKISLFCIACYSIASILALQEDAGALEYWRVAARGFLILLGGFGVTRVNLEVKRYDQLHKKEFILARTDRLTGLANRHYFDQKLIEEVEYADYSGNPLNILIFDLDNFKKFNDSYGHIWGDKLLTLFSDIIKQNIRKSDIPVRYGGEEFLILIRDLDIVISKNVGERIRRQLEKQKIYVGEDKDRRKVTVSCGVAQYPRHSRNIKTAVDMADKALYRAKEAGKNMVVTYDEIED